jgi:putative hydrolase of the HAD superfamily
MDDSSPDEFLMVGNSLRSDVLPVIAAGGQVVHVPYEITWEHETVVPEEEATYVTASSLRNLLGMLLSD